jgi:transposase-like protein
VAAEAELARIVKGYADSAPKLAAWLEQNVPEGLDVFSLPETHWRRMRTANPIERAIQQELKRRTRKIRVFPNQAALERLATAILVEIDEQWIASDRTYLTMNDRDE